MVIEVSNFEYNKACKAASERLETATDEEVLEEEEALPDDDEDEAEAVEDKRDAISEPKEERIERKCIFIRVIARV